MREFSISVKKITDVGLMREACEMTFNGHSSQSLLSIYKSEHSPVRTQMFWVRFMNIPLFISTHILRHHVGSTPYQLTCRDDRDGANPMLPERIKVINEKLEEVKMYGVEKSKNLDAIENDLANIAENCDRNTPVNLGLFLNAQSLIDMAKLRLCNQAHKDTIKVFQALKDKVAEVDPELASLMVRKCVYRNGLCGEPRCCGYNTTPAFLKEKIEYLRNFSNKQCGIKQ